MTEPRDSSPERRDAQAVGPYHIVQLIGEGGMGVVYAAEQLRPVRRRVALKMMKPGMDSEEVVARFDAERQALAVMDHPGIAKVLDAGVAEDGRPYFAMELVKGIRIDEYCDRFNLTFRQRIELFIQLCHAVQHAHQKGVIHRDLKPSNVLVTEQDGRAVPKIIDFGIAKAIGWHLSDLPTITSLGVPIGTLAYMSPEQAEGSDLDVDTRADIYSLGVILYELLSGSVPADVKAKGAPAFLAQLVSRDTPFPTPKTRLTSSQDTERIAVARGTTFGALKKALSGDIQWVVMKALEKDRSRRYETANGLALELQRYLDDEPVLARAPSAAYRFRKLVRRHRAAVAASTVAVLALAGGTVAATLGMVRARAAREAAVAAESRAATEARTAKQVSDFLVNLFEVSDPDESRGDTVTAREILDRGAERVETQLADDPLVQSRLMETMGTVYQGLGLYDDSRRLLTRALALRKSALGDNDPQVAESLWRLGSLQLARGDLASSEENMRNAMAILDRTPSPDSSQVAKTLLGLGGAVLAQGHSGDAEPFITRALDIEQRRAEPDQKTVAVALQDLGVVAYYKGQMSQATQYWSRSVALQESQFGQDYPGVASLLNNLGGAYFTEGHYDQALQAYEHARAIWSRTLEPDHPRFGTILTNIGETYDALGRYKEAEPLLVKALSIKERVLSPDDPNIATTLRVLGDVYRDRGRYAEAEARYRRAIRIIETALGPKSSRLGEILDHYAEMLRDQGRNGDAARVEARRAALDKG